MVTRCLARTVRVLAQRPEQLFGIAGLAPLKLQFFDAPFLHRDVSQGLCNVLFGSEPSSWVQGMTTADTAAPASSVSGQPFGVRLYAAGRGPPPA